MIVLNVVDDKPQESIGQAVAQEVVVKEIPDTPLDDYCLCSIGLFRCEYKELAFYGGSNVYENDYTTMYVNKVDATDVIKFFLIDSSTDIEVELNEANKAMYGVYSEDSSHKGIDIDFTTLQTNFPTLRDLKFRIDQNVFGKALTRTTHAFQLVKWNEERADGTVRIETLNSGNIESGNDYNALNWRRSVRIKGKLGQWTPDIQTDNYINGERIIKQIQDKIIVDYTLETELLPADIYKAIILNDTLANGVFISDYNLTNVNYKRVDLQPKSITAEHYEKNPNGSFEIVFTERKQNHVKHNL